MLTAKRLTVGGAAVAIAAIAAALLVITLTRSAHASTNAMPSIPGVTLGPDGLATFSPAAQAQQREAGDLLDAGPAHVTCSAPTAGVLSCSPVADNRVDAALQAGTTVYERRVYALEPGMATSNVPLFGADEITCNGLGGAPSAADSCTPVSTAPPTVAPGASTIVTYAPLNVREINGTPTVIMTKPSVAIGG